jgi:hypothetical protein
MTVTIEFSSPEEEAAVKALAAAEGLSVGDWLRKVARQHVHPFGQEQSGQPFETGYGMWAKYGPATSAEEIDENRREMFRNFAQC